MTKKEHNALLKRLEAAVDEIDRITDELDMLNASLPYSREELREILDELIEN